MKPLVRWAIRLYPSAWRARYGAELEALVDDAGVRSGDVWDMVRGAMFMQMTGVGFWKIVAGCTAAGILAAGIWSAAMTDQYGSTAVMKLSVATPAASGDSQGMQRTAQLRRLQDLQQGALSRTSLGQIIQEQKLFAEKRRRRPFSEIIQEMRNSHIRIQLLDRPGDALFSVTYLGDDPTAAQAATRALVTALVEQNVKQPQDAPANLEVIDPASLPSEPVGHDRAAMLGRGGLGGLLVGLLSAGVFWLAQRRKQLGLRRVAAFAFAGMALGLIIALLIPNEFVSTAVLRTADGAKLDSTIAQVLSDERLAEIIRRDGLFPDLVRRDGIAKAAQKMRNEHIRVQSVTGGIAGRACVVSFRYNDRFMAQRVTRELTAQLIFQTNAQILDPASDPIYPSSPNRSAILLAGISAGMLLGLVASYQRAAKLAST